MTESQVAEQVAKLVSAETGRGAAIDGNYVSKLERGKITWPNSAYRRAFREIFEVETDADLGFYAMRTRRDAEQWLAPHKGEAQQAVAQQAVAQQAVAQQAVTQQAATQQAATQQAVTQQAVATRPPPQTPQQAAEPEPTDGAGAADRAVDETRRTPRAPTAPSSRSRPAFRLSGIRWMPVLLASLAATVGWLAYSTVTGQNPASAAHHGSYQAGGLRLAVDEMTWISSGMNGLGRSRSPARAAGSAVDPAVLPANRSAGNTRLHLEVDLENITSAMQKYDADDFRVIGPGGQNWQVVKIAESATITHGLLQPGYKVTLDVYFDIPVNQNKGLSIEWSRGGDTVHFPVNTTGASIAPM